MPEDRRERSWDSVCADCVHFAGDRCERTLRAAAPQDSIAAICRWYEGGAQKNKFAFPICYNQTIDRGTAPNQKEEEK